MNKFEPFFKIRDKLRSGSIVPETRDKISNYGTVPENPGRLATLLPVLFHPSNFVRHFRNTLCKSEF
jgi:hypothetical protein